MKAIFVKRLKRLIKELYRAAKNQDKKHFKFDLNVCAVTKEKHTDAQTAIQKALGKDNFCGTSACAYGIAGSIPEFNRAGLTLKSHDSNENSDDGNNFFDLHFRHITGHHAAEFFFGLDPKEAEWLFMPCYYRTKQLRDPLAVVARIKFVLKYKVCLGTYQEDTLDKLEQLEAEERRNAIKRVSVEFARKRKAIEEQFASL